MKKLKLAGRLLPAWLATSLVIFMASYFLCMPFKAEAVETVTQVKTILPVAIPDTKESRATFNGLRPEALQIGLGEAVLIGAISYESLADKTTRITVNWHSIGIMSGAATQTLRSPLTSQFRTDAKTVDPGTFLSVRGDLDSLADDFILLKSKLVKDTPRDLVRQTNNTHTSNDASKGLDSLSPSGASSTTPSSAPYSFDNNNNKVTTDQITTQWQDCQPRIDRPAYKVYAQARRIDITASGRVMSTGNCEDHGSIADITKTYDGTCSPVVDVANRKVIHQYTEYATLDNKKVDVSLCSVDATKYDPILASINGCGYRHDFVAGKSIQQEKLYYNDATGKLMPVRDCGDSDHAYTQYVTQNTCTPTVDTKNKQVFINVRTAFKDDNGAEHYANDCRPDGNQAIAIQEAFCNPKYEHDFVNHVSYYSSRSYYLDSTGKVVYVSNCARSTSNSFPHVFNTASCGATNDDAALMTHVQKTTQIVTPDDGTLEIAPCEETGSPIPYAYISETNKTYQTPKFSVNEGQTIVWPSIRSKVNDATIDWTSSSNIFEVKGSYNDMITNSRGMYGEFIWSSIQGALGSKRLKDENTSPVLTYSNGGSTTNLGYITGDLYYPKYLRSDGSIYTKPTTSRVFLNYVLCAGLESPFTTGYGDAANYIYCANDTAW